ncbi:hypothetical protein EUTSA_v10002269mg [Eutrema salsugineum]|uniref:At2g35280-like TPR domain-containing protein n=1 Tax=Eutrema salsugineum TaxID=72664 RepID=V4LHY0_EUTSA|nr:hypothetical protein EUTSA_v10002269mg [Eutrema salsugineum]
MLPKRTLSNFEKLPNDLLGDILSRVAEISRTSLRNTMAASPELAKVANDKRVNKKMNLNPLAMKPLQALNRYTQLMERCLQHRNTEVHYIKGIQEYFHRNNTNIGLHHLKSAAEGSYENGMYIYGIIMLCRGAEEEGKKYLEKLGWKQNKGKATQC